MPRWQPFDVVGGAYADDTRPWSVQDTVNYLVVNAERPGARSSKMLRDVPGMVTFCASMPESPVRGAYVAEGRLFAVVGTSLYSIGTDGAATSLGTIPGVGRCVFTHNQITNGNEVVIGNGQSGYVYDTVAGTLTQITDKGFPGFRSVDFHDQYVIGVEPFGRYWLHSDLADAASYNTLDRAEAEKAPDRIQQAISTGPDVFVLGERTGQFFYNTGEATGTFANRSGAEMDVGAASPWTACRLDNTVYWLGNDGSVYRLNGYVPQRISTHALEQAISRCTLSDAYAFTFEDRGHKCYLLTFPDGRTWCFDAATQEWTRRESYGFDRWRVSALVKWGRHWIAGDFINGRLYQLDWYVKTEAGEPLERRRVCGALHDEGNRLIVNALRLEFDTGMDEDSPPLPQPILAPLSISGDVPDGEVGEAVSGAYSVSGGVLPRGSVTVTSGTFPPGLTLNPDGTYSGTYSTPGSYSWVVQVTDGYGTAATLPDSAAVAGSILEDAPILYWKLNETSGATVIDYSGNGYNGTISGTPTRSDSGLTLNALTDGAFYPGNALGSVLDVGTDNTWAISAVITRNGNGGTVWEQIAGQFRSAAQGQMNCLLALAGNSVPVEQGRPMGRFADVTSGNSRVVQDGVAVANGERMLLMVVREPPVLDPVNGGMKGVLRLYKNGVEIEANLTGFGGGEVGMPSTGAKFIVGGDPDPSYYATSYGARMKIEHVAVFDTAITAERALYHAQLLGLA